MLRVLSVACLTLLLSGCITYPITQKIWDEPGAAVLAPKALRQLSTDDGYVARSDYFKSADGTPLHALVLVRPGAKVSVLYLGGNNFETGTFGLEVGKGLEKLGVDALILDYPGYGGSEGKFGIPELKSAGLAAFDHMQSLSDFKDKPAVVWGFSLGSMVAPAVANARSVQGLILESTATNVRDWAHNATPWYAKPFVHFTYEPDLLGIDNAAALREYRGPLLLLVGSRDTITPPKFSRALYRVSATPVAEKTLVVVPGAEHGSAAAKPDGVGALRAFLAGVAGR